MNGNGDARADNRIRYTLEIPEALMVRVKAVKTELETYPEIFPLMITQIRESVIIRAALILGLPYLEAEIAYHIQERRKGPPLEARPFERPSWADMIRGG